MNPAPLLSLVPAVTLSHGALMPLAQVVYLHAELSDVATWPIRSRPRSSNMSEILFLQTVLEGSPTSARLVLGPPFTT